MASWNWDEALSRVQFVDQSVANTDNDDSTKGKQGYDYANFSEITPTPVTCYPLHEDSGTTAHDLVGSTDGTYNGPTLGQTSILGTTCPSYDGNDDYIDLGTVSHFPLSGATALCVSFWANIPTKSTQRRIWNHRDSGGNDSAILVTSSNTLRLVIRDDGGGTSDLADIPLTNGSWTRYDFNWSAANGFSVYQDGTAVTSQAKLNSDNASELRSSSDDLVTIGSDPNVGQHFDGQLSDFRFYDQTLTSGQVQILYDVVRSSGDWLGDGKLL